MGKYRKKPIIIDAITFDEFIAYGEKHADTAVNNMPWAFTYNGHPVTHENDTCYLIPTNTGVHQFTPDDMLITGIEGEIYPCKVETFHQMYEPLLEQKTRGNRRSHSDLHERLDLIWENAKPCKCGNDDNWHQELDGSILCVRCDQEVRA